MTKSTYNAPAVTDHGHASARTLGSPGTRIELGQPKKAV